MRAPTKRQLITQLAVSACLLSLPLWAGDLYKVHVAALIGTYWVLIAGLNLVAGYTGQISVGHVGLLCIGAYTFAILAGRHGWHPMLALPAAGGITGLFGLLLGLPSLRLPGFYFALTTLASALIVNEIALAQHDLTGGGVGLPVPGFPAPFDTPAGTYWLILGVASLVTWLTWNVARRMWGRALVAVRDSGVTAQAVGVPVFRAKLTVFVFSGITAGLAGGLFASLQSYITPDTFLVDLGLFFFVCIIIGGRGRILGPLLGTIILTALPEVAAPLAKLGTFFYGLLLLVVVLLAPEGIGPLFEGVLVRLRGQKAQTWQVKPELDRLVAASASLYPENGRKERSRVGTIVASEPQTTGDITALRARGISKRFGALQALSEVTLDVRPGEVHGLIGPNGSGKTTLLNLLSGYYRVDAGNILVDDEDLSGAPVQRRPRVGVARTFQTPRLLPTLTVLDNAMVGGWPLARAGFFATAFGLAGVQSEERVLHRRAEELLHGVGLGAVLNRRASLLGHAEQRFLEIARGLMARPRFMLLDEPAGGLTGAEIGHLGEIIKVMREAGIGVLLVEHHTDFVFRVSDRVTTLDLGRTIKHGAPQEVRNDPEVIRVYLGA